MYKLFHLRHLWLRIAYARICLLFLLIAFFLLVTLFLGAVLVIEYQCSVLLSALFCLIPWLIVIAITIVVLFSYRVAYDREKAELAEYGRNVLISKAVVFVLNFLGNRKKKN